MDICGIFFRLFIWNNLNNSMYNNHSNSVIFWKLTCMLPLWLTLLKKKKRDESWKYGKLLFKSKYVLLKLFKLSSSLNSHSLILNIDTKVKSDVLKSSISVLLMEPISLLLIMYVSRLKSWKNFSKRANIRSRIFTILKLSVWFCGHEWISAIYEMNTGRSVLNV